MITKNQIYTYIKKRILADYPKLYVTSERTYAVAKFPCLQLVEITAANIDPTFDFSDNNYRITMECQAFSNKKSGGAEEVYDIIRKCETYFNEIGFRMTINEPTENTKEITIKRHLARFTRVVATNDSIGE